MSRSIIGGLIANGVKPEKLIAADPSEDQRQSISNLFSIKTLDKLAIAEGATIVRIGTAIFGQRNA